MKSSQGILDTKIFIANIQIFVRMIIYRKVCVVCVLFEVLISCYDISRAFVFLTPFSSVFYLASAGVDLSLIPPSCKSRMHTSLS